MKKFKLIDGEFSPDEGRDILLSVFQSKIQFHNLRNFSSKERFGKEDEIALKRISQLKKELEKILEEINVAEKNGEFVQIKSEGIITTRNKVLGKK